MFQTFKQLLEKNNLFYPKKHVLLAVSGGVDSVVLLHLMQGIDEDKRPELSVAHVNHQLRENSDEDEVFVRELAESYGFPFYSHTWKKEDHPKSGIEEAARNIRYTFFKEIMNDFGATVLMTAHHQDDQVETILMKLTRGSSLEQLTGIHLTQPFNNGQLLRPLLPFSKEELYKYAEDHRLKYVEDITNRTNIYTRNRFRNQIIPLIKQENVQFNEHVEQFAQDIRDVLEISKRPINEKFNKIVRKNRKSFSFNYAQFFHEEKPMQRAILKKILAAMYQDFESAYKTTYIELIRSWLIEGEVNTSLDLLNRWTVRKDYKNVIFEKEQEKEPGSNERYLLKEMNEWVDLSSTEKIGIFEHDGHDDAETLVFHADRVKFPLRIRHRNQGDRMRYKGLDGTKKIKDIFIDDKVAPEKRKQAWVVEDADGQILWVISYRKMYLLSDIETDKIAYAIKYKIKDDE